MSLNKRQKAFCDEYIANGFNATQAAIAAGYSKKTAGNIGFENLEKPEIKKYIAERTKKAEQDRIARGDEVLELLTSILRGEEEAITFTATGKRCKAIDQKNQLKAAELLAKCHGLTVQNVNLQGDVSVTFVDDIPEDDS